MNREPGRVDRSSTGSEYSRSFLDPVEVRRLRILSRRLVTSTFAGDYKSVFRGRGVEFEEVREYVPGDEVGCIDWNVTARTGIPHVKRFVEEREMTLMILLDRSASQYCQTPRRPKYAVAAEVCCLISLAAASSNDRVGMIAFTDRVERYIPPTKGYRQVRRVIQEIIAAPPGGSGTDIANALDYLNMVTRRRLYLCIVSDFFSSDFTKPLALAARRHDVLAVTVTDPYDLQLPDVGLLDVADPENGRRRLIDTGNSGVRKCYAERALARRTELARRFSVAGIRHVDVDTEKPPINELIRFFQANRRQTRG